MDGFGILHPRRCGSASQLGLLAGLPTVGVAKSLLHLEGLLSQREARRSVLELSHQPSRQQQEHHQQQQSAEPYHSGEQPGVSEQGLPPLQAQAQQHEAEGPCPSVHQRRGQESQQRQPKQEQEQHEGQQAVGPSEIREHSARRASASAPWLPLRAASGEVLGAAVCPQGTTRPIFVSLGHRISLPTAVDLTLHCCLYRSVPTAGRRMGRLTMG